MRGCWFKPRCEVTGANLQPEEGNQPDRRDKSFRYTSTASETVRVPVPFTVPVPVPVPVPRRTWKDHAVHSILKA
jgi:hypothetical protein